MAIAVGIRVASKFYSLKYIVLGILFPFSLFCYPLYRNTKLLSIRHCCLPWILYSWCCVRFHMNFSWLSSTNSR